jgi:hypothetical protein
VRRRKRWRKDWEARGRGDSASQPRLPLLLSRQEGDEDDIDDLVVMMMKMTCVAWFKVEQWQAW